jgi:hypothetical protein
MSSKLKKRIVKPTTIIGKDGIEYVVSGGRLVEKCQHRTITNKSSGKERWEVCHDCGKTLIYNKDTTENSTQDFINGFRSRYGRNPNGRELSAML